MDTFTTILRPILEVLLTIAITVLLPVGLAALWKWFGKLGLEVDQKHRDALQTAIANAALVAVSRLGGPAAATTISGAALNAAVDWTVLKTSSLSGFDDSLSPVGWRHGNGNGAWLL